MAGLPTVETLVVIPFLRDRPDLGELPKAVPFEQFIAGDAKSSPTFEPVRFDHPLCILYSSGPTGMPQCLVHSHGGALLTHLTEHEIGRASCRGRVCRYGSISVGAAP